MQHTERCAVANCPKLRRRRDWCFPHYMRWRRTGMPTGSARPSAIERFMSHVDDSGGPDSCHPWKSSRNDRGYGQFRLAGRTHLAPRWLLGHLRGRPLKLPEVSCHTCDNPPCCNPAHLYIGSQKTNAADAIARGRHRNIPAERRRSQTHCKRGHEFNAANTYVTPLGKRECRPCRAIRNKEWLRRRQPASP